MFQNFEFDDSGGQASGANTFSDMNLDDFTSETNNQNNNLPNFYQNTKSSSGIPKFNVNTTNTTTSQTGIFGGNNKSKLNFQSFFAQQKPEQKLNSGFASAMDAAMNSTPSNNNSSHSNIIPANKTLFGKKIDFSSFKNVNSPETNNNNTNMNITAQNTPIQSLLPKFGATPNIENHDIALQNQDNELKSLLQLFNTECKLTKYLDISELVSEVNSIKSQNEVDFMFQLEAKVRQVMADAKNGNWEAPLPCQSEASKKLLELMTRHWKKRNGLLNEKHMFQTRKQNRRNKRKRKRQEAYMSRLGDKQKRVHLKQQSSNNGLKRKRKRRKKNSLKFFATQDK